MHSRPFHRNTSLTSPLCAARRSHRPQHEVGRSKFLLVHLQQSRPGRRRRRSLGSAQPTGGHGRQAAHRRLPGVRRFPAPLGRRAGEPDPAAELSRGPELLTRPVLHCRSPSHVLQYLDRPAHKDTNVRRVILQCTVGPVGVVSLLYYASGLL